MKAVAVPMGKEALELERLAKSTFAIAVEDVFDAYAKAEIPEGFAPESADLSAIHAALLYTLDAATNEAIKRRGFVYSNQMVAVVQQFAARAIDAIMESQGVTKQ